MSLYSTSDLAASATKRPQIPSVAKRAVFNGATAVTVATDIIAVPRHRLQTGDPVFYTAGGGTVITGLSETAQYYAIRVDQDNFKLASTLALAIAGTAVDITVAGAGTSHVVYSSDIIFVSQEEALLTANKVKGINGAGWWKINEKIDTDGNPRYRSELLASLTVLNAVSGDNPNTQEDLLAADAEASITLGTIANQTTVTGGATFTTVGQLTVNGGGTAIIQWQKSVAGSTKFANVSGQTATTLVLAGQTIANTGDRYRVMVTSTAGAPKVVSNAATLTFGT